MVIIRCDNAWRQANGDGIEAALGTAFNGTADGLMIGKTRVGFIVRPAAACRPASPSREFVQTAARVRTTKLVSFQIPLPSVFRVSLKPLDHKGAKQNRIVGLTQSHGSCSAALQREIFENGAGARNVP
jgi:hypothetical protein